MFRSGQDGATAGGRQLPANEREARVFFLLPPDRVDVRVHQTEVFRWGRLGADWDDGRDLMAPGEGRGFLEPPTGARGPAEGSGARGEMPFGPPERLLPDTVFSVLEVDRTVERYSWSAAPVYPPELSARGVEGSVIATYVVDTIGRVDTSTVRVLHSDDPRFTQSVRTALGGMRFRPAMRAGRPVRQVVEQRFRFQVLPAGEIARQVLTPT